MLTRRKTGGAVVLATLAVLLQVAREDLPAHGWGLAVRWVLAGLLTLGWVLLLAGSTADVVRGFRRGLSGEDGGRSGRRPPRPVGPVSRGAGTDGPRG